MNILYCGDGAIQDGVLLSVMSLLENTCENVNVYILTASLEDEGGGQALPESFGTFLNDLVKKSSVNSSVQIIDITSMFTSALPRENMTTRFTPFCMLRLFADEITELPNKILYLDTDVICLKDPIEFYEQDLEGYELAGVLDYYGSRFFRNNIFEKDYLNSGVLLLDLEKIRESGLFSECRKLCTERKMFMPDQSAINKLCCRKKICEGKYNEQRKIKNDTVFRHFTTSFRFFPMFRTVKVKPWNRDGLHSVLNSYELDPLLDKWENTKKLYEESMRQKHEFQ